MLKDLAREQEQTTRRVNISEFSRETGFDRKTVRRYPGRVRLLQEIQARGYTCRATILGNYLR